MRKLDAIGGGGTGIVTNLQESRCDDVGIGSLPTADESSQEGQEREDERYDEECNTRTSHVCNRRCRLLYKARSTNDDDGNDYDDAKTRGETVCAAGRICITGQSWQCQTRRPSRAATETVVCCAAGIFISPHLCSVKVRAQSSRILIRKRTHTFQSPPFAQGSNESRTSERFVPSIAPSFITSFVLFAFASFLLPGVGVVTTWQQVG